MLGSWEGFLYVWLLWELGGFPTGLCCFLVVVLCLLSLSDLGD